MGNKTIETPKNDESYVRNSKFEGRYKQQKKKKLSTYNNKKKNKDRRSVRWTNQSNVFNDIVQNDEVNQEGKKKKLQKKKKTKFFFFFT